MGFDAERFMRDVADSSKTVLEDFMEDPKTTLASYGLDITDTQSEAIKAANTSAKSIPDLTTICAPVQPF